MDIDTITIIHVCMKKMLSHHVKMYMQRHVKKRSTIRGKWICDIFDRNDELSNQSDTLASELGRSEGQGSWDSEEAEVDQESFDSEATTPDSQETLNDTEPDNPEEYQAAKDDEEEEPAVDDTEEQEDDEQKNTPQDNIRRVLSYSDYFSSND